MLKELLTIFVIAIVFIVDCGYTVETSETSETQCKGASECDCKSLLEDKVSDLVSLVDRISPEH